MNQTVRLPVAATVLMTLVFGGLVLPQGCTRAVPQGTGSNAEEKAASPAASSGGTAEKVAPGHKGKTVEVSADAQRRSEIVLGRAGPSEIRVRTENPGEVRLNSELTVEVRPRFPGVVSSLHKRLGEDVRTGEAVATIQSNESLTNYAVTAPMAGTVIARGASVGQSVEHETILYTLANLSTVWVEFSVYPQDLNQIHRGQAVDVLTESDPVQASSGRIDYVGPVMEQETRTTTARVVLRNASHQWKPGQFVRVLVTLQQVRVPVAVPTTAIVRMSSGPAVFRVHGRRFELQVVAIGRSDRDKTEITSGLSAGDSIAVKNAFLLKAELGRAEVEGDD